MDEQGQVKAGAKEHLRQWTEYWTFIRSRSGTEGTQQRACPNCGAPVRLGTTGICDFCGGN